MARDISSITSFHERHLSLLGNENERECLSSSGHQTDSPLKCSWFSPLPCQANHFLSLSLCTPFNAGNISLLVSDLGDDQPPEVFRPEDQRILP